MKRALTAAFVGLGLMAGPAFAADMLFTNWFYDGPFKAAFEAYKVSYAKKYPTAPALAVETIPFPKYHDVLNVKIASGTPPDLAIVLGGIAPSMLEADLFLDLKPYIDEVKDYNLADFGPSIKPWEKDGKVLAIPLTNASNAVYYNLDVFAKAGVPTPKELQAQGKWTWDNARETAKALQAKGGARYGFVFGNLLFQSGWQNLVDIYPAYGGGPWSADGKTCTLNSPESVAALKLVYDMMYTDKTHPQAGVDVDFAAGDIGMSLTRPTFAFRLAKVPFKWDIITAPAGPKGFVPSRAQNPLVIFKTAPNAKDAARFLINATTRENGQLWTASAPPRLSLQTTELMLPNNALTKEQLVAAVTPAMQSEKFQLEYGHKNYSALQPEIQRLFAAEVWQPGVDVQKATTSVCNQIASLLK